ncbi:MAG: thrombospondin type 3 repeat-containing protein, partial [Acidobacteriota bacterium]
MVALLLEASPAASPADLTEALISSAADLGAPGWDTQHGAGLIDALAALDLLPTACVGQGGDVDGDGVCGDVDNCPLEPNPDQLDNEPDGTGDVCDPDDDNDGVEDPLDNCPFDANSGQEDNEPDGTGDVCDPDDDNDGVEDPTDNCPLLPNADQADSDEDGLGNVCDVCPLDAANDADGDT